MTTSLSGRGANGPESTQTSPPANVLLDFPAEEGTRSLRFSRTKSGFAKKTISLHKSEHACVRTQAWRNMLTKINTQKRPTPPPQLYWGCEYRCVNVCPVQTCPTFTEPVFFLLSHRNARVAQWSHFLNSSWQIDPAYSCDLQSSGPCSRLRLCSAAV